MNLKTLTLALAALTSSLPAGAAADDPQTPSKATIGYSDSLVATFESLPDAEASKFLDDHGDPVSDYYRMLASAISKKRYGLLIPLFENRGTYDFLLCAAKQMPDSLEKDELVINMLRWDSPVFWRPDVIENPNAVRDPSVFYGPKLPVEPFVSVISKYLPAISMNEQLIAKAKRMKLADQLTVEIERVRSTTGGTTRPGSPRDRRPLQSRPDLPDASPSATGARDAAADGSAAHLSRWFAAAAAALLVFAAALVWWRSTRRRNPRS